MGPVDNLLGKKQDEAAAGQLGMIKRNARRLLNLVNQLLDFRRLEEQELTLHALPGEIIGFVHEVFDSFTDMAARQKISYQLQCNVPSLFVAFDHNKLERILFNLLSNAFKFTQSSGTIQLQVQAAEQTTEAGTTTWLTLRVTDTGMGIAPEKQDKIFDRYFQSNTAAAILSEGSGIGLSITKEFVQMHGGTITVCSQPGAGTTFTVQLPFAVMQPLFASNAAPPALPLSAADTLPEEPATPPAQPYDAGEKVTLLLVEDNEDFRFYLKDNLRTTYQRGLAKSTGPTPAADSE
jgi:signal transduction histidine kinase